MFCSQLWLEMLHVLNQACDGLWERGCIFSLKLVVVQIMTVYCRACSTPNSCEFRAICTRSEFQPMPDISSVALWASEISSSWSQISLLNWTAIAWTVLHQDLAHQARNSCELGVQQAVQYTVMICANVGLRLNTHASPLSQDVTGWFSTRIMSGQTDNTIFTGSREPFPLHYTWSLWRLEC